MRQRFINGDKNSHCIGDSITAYGLKQVAVVCSDEQHMRARVDHRHQCGSREHQAHPSPPQWRPATPRNLHHTQTYDVSGAQLARLNSMPGRMTTAVAQAEDGAIDARNPGPPGAGGQFPSSPRSPGKLPAMTCPAL
eukprot:scaffold220183_cov24-Prasinocladus_malaysianus.AAC.1